MEQNWEKKNPDPYINFSVVIPLEEDKENPFDDLDYVLETFRIKELEVQIGYVCPKSQKPEIEKILKLHKLDGKFKSQ